MKDLKKVAQLRALTHANVAKVEALLSTSIARAHARKDFKPEASPLTEEQAARTAANQGKHIFWYSHPNRNVG